MCMEESQTLRNFNFLENRPPQFTIPRTVYAILNNDFEIQIMAVDPENQDMTFTLLPNGTLSTARISKKLLTISNLKENGTVYIQVQDEMGAKNILIFQVNVFECQCVHSGKCYQNKTIVYPVQPSDYLCQCEDPYTGDRCEIRPNPCDELPCYPGLNCSTAQNSEGFTCEECPTLFQGDGKQCELKPTEGLEEIKLNYLFFAICIPLYPYVFDHSTSTLASRINLPIRGNTIKYKYLNNI